MATVRGRLAGVHHQPRAARGVAATDGRPRGACSSASVTATRSRSTRSPGCTTWSRRPASRRRRRARRPRPDPPRRSRRPRRRRGRVVRPSPARPPRRLPPAELARRRERHDVALVLVAAGPVQLDGDEPPVRCATDWTIWLLRRRPSARVTRPPSGAIMSLAAGTQLDAVAAVVLAVVAGEAVSSPSSLPQPARTNTVRRTGSRRPTGDRSYDPCRHGSASRQPEEPAAVDPDVLGRGDEVRAVAGVRKRTAPTRSSSGTLVPLEGTLVRDERSHLRPPGRRTRRRGARSRARSCSPRSPIRRARVRAPA